jgi:hypothetical protein
MVAVAGRLVLGNHEAHRLAVNHQMVGIGQINTDLRACSQSNDGQGFTPWRQTQCQGRSFTEMWRWPMRGETATAARPNTCAICRLSVRYWMATRPCRL